jgi:muramoyltetrapeptide carboxypeptidase
MGAVVAAPLFAAAPPRPATSEVRKPKRLKAGDAVGIVTPATPLDDAFDYALADEAMRAMGLVPRHVASLDRQYGYFSASDKERADELMAMFRDPSIAAIFAIRGGWGCQRILPYLDWDVIRANPKLLIGFSDITALHLAIAAKGGFVTLHGPNANSSWNKFSYAAFREIAFEGRAPLLANPVANEDRLIQRKGRTRTLRGGKARGRLLGGNLAVLSAMVGTPWLPDFDGAILFIEEIEEAPYRIDRMLTQMGQAGILRKLAGVVFGQCTNCVATGDVSGFTLSDVLNQHLSPLGIPAFAGSQFGHVADQFTLPLGVRAEVDADAGTIQLLESAVA